MLRDASGQLPSRITVSGGPAPTDASGEPWLAFLSPPPDLGSEAPLTPWTVETWLPAEGSWVIAPALASIDGEGRAVRVPVDLLLPLWGALRGGRTGDRVDVETRARLATCVAAERFDLSQPDPLALRRFCLGVMATMQVPTDPVALEPHLVSTDGATRFYAVWALTASARGRELTEPEHAAVVRAAGDLVPEVQSLAATDLLSRRDPAIAAVARAEVAWASPTVVTRFYPLLKPEVRLPPPQATLARALGVLDTTPEGAEVLYMLLDSEAQPVAFAALRGLEGRRDPGLAPALLARIEGAPGPSAHLFLRALGRLGDPRATQPLSNLVLDPAAPRVVREQAAVALGRIGDVRAIPPLEGATRDAELSVAVAAAEALGRLGHPGGAEAAAAVLDRASTGEGRSRVAFALSLLGGETARQALGRCLATPEARACEGALGRVMLLAAAGTEGAARATLTRAPLPSAEDLSWAVQLTAAWRLTALCPELHLLFDTLAAQRAPPRGLQAEIVRALLHLGQTPTAAEAAQLAAEEDRLGLNL